MAGWSFDQNNTTFIPQSIYKHKLQIHQESKCEKMRPYKYKEKNTGEFLYTLGYVMIQTPNVIKD